MTSIDARGLACPAPVVKARAAIADLPQAGGLVQILVDNPLAAENLERMSTAAGHSAARQDQGAGTYTVTITVGKGARDAAVTSSHTSTPGPVVAIGSNSMGKGANELGEILIKGFLYTLTQLDPPPQTLLLFNGGVKLAAADANTHTDLETLSQRGTRILVCGTCVNYYGIDIAVGEIANMLDIVEAMQSAEKLINL